MLQTPSESAKFWWQPIRLGDGQGHRWHLGTLEILILHSGPEWHLAHSHPPYDADVSEGWSGEPIDSISEEATNPERFSADTADEQVVLVPRVAERSVVVSPRMPLHILPGHETKFYVSSPVWVEVAVGRDAKVLRNIPAKRLSDTWFGPSTREGQVAFALKTFARVRLAEMPRAPQRVVTPVLVRNHSQELLTIERLNLPVPFLSIFHSDRGDLWTETVELEHHGDAEMASLDIRPGAPVEADGATRLSEPREIADQRVLVRAFSKILRTLDLED
jgi:hypothetical protein